MSDNVSGPTLRELFGDLDFREADLGRSVYSPAAYLADLLQMLEDELPVKDFKRFASRRPDIAGEQGIILDGEQSFTNIPHLEIVNRVMAAQVKHNSGGMAAEAVLASAQHPLALPIEVHFERLRRLLQLLRVSHRDLYSRFARHADVDVLAAERLGLSPVRARAVLDVLKDEQLRAAYGLASEESFADICELERFKRATGIDGATFRKLFYGRLSPSSFNALRQSERQAAGELFTNAGLDGYVTLDAPEAMLLWTSDSGANSGNIPEAWFDRVQRLLRLSRWTGIDLDSLELCLRRLCGNQLDGAALRRLAVMVDLRDRCSAPWDVLCSLFDELSGNAALGAADDPALAGSLFDRIFNGAEARLAKSYVPSGQHYIPAVYASWVRLEITGDLLSDEVTGSQELRTRIQRALGISARDLVAIVTRFRERAMAQQRTSILDGNLGERGLSVLHRIARLAELTELPPLELLRLVDVLEGDSRIKQLNAFDVLQPGVTTATDLYQVLERVDQKSAMEDRFWLIQNLFAIGWWANAEGLTPDDLSAVTLPTEAAAAQMKADLVRLSQGLIEAFEPSQLQTAQLESAQINPRTARIALEHFCQPTRRLASPADARIVTYNAGAAFAAAHDVIPALAVVSVDDLLSLQLGEGLAAHLYAVLVRRGLLDEEGVLRSERLPAQPQELVLEPDLCGSECEVFDRFFEMHKSEIASGKVASEVELELFPSDLLTLGFEVVEADEFIERLRILDVIDTAGVVRDPSFFAQAENRERFRTRVGLDAHVAEIHALLASRETRWLATPLVLPDDVWSGLGMGADQQEALVQNLIFNGHLDAQRRIVDRKAILAVSVENFDLALQFQRQHGLILGALQAVIKVSRRGVLRVDSEALRPIADRILACEAHFALSKELLTAEGQPTSELLQMLSSDVSDFKFDAPLSISQFGQFRVLLQQITLDADACRLTDAALASIDITEEHAENVLQTLQDSGVLRPDRTLVAERVETLAQLNAALDFAVPGYADYSREIFFLLHDVAVTVSAKVNSLITSLAEVEAAQSEAVLGALSAELELSPAATASIVKPLLRDAAHPISALIAPVLVARRAGVVFDEPPADRVFVSTLRRARQFANYARKLRMSAREIDVAFTEQELVDKFPEPLHLPAGVDRIDALWSGPGGKIYLFRGPFFWTFDSSTLQPIDTQQPVKVLSPEFEALREVDAVYTTPGGDHYLLAEGSVWRLAAGSNQWFRSARLFGRVASHFEDPERIDAAFQDQEGRVCLFAKDQYVRYERLPSETVDEGYPQRIATHWPVELGFGRLPATFATGIDAAVGRKDSLTWMFNGQHFVTSTEPGIERPIVDHWGRVRHELASAARIDAVLDLDGRCAVIVGDQLTAFDNSLETEGLCADAGYPRTLVSVFPDLPEHFRHGIDAGLTVEGQRTLFREGLCATRSGTEVGWTESPTRDSRFARVRNVLLETGQVDAAFMGLDGRTYLFSGNQYVRYSGADLSRIDEGFPRTIREDWGGLERVDAACTLAGMTYLFGSGEQGGMYMCYSSRNYKSPDQGYPKPTQDNFWNLPQALLDQGFRTPDAVFVAPEGRTYLFSGDQVIGFEHNHRWWSEPRPISEVWNGMPFNAVSAAFTARDGRSYLFSSESEPRFARYSDSTLQRLDDRFPKPSKGQFGKLANNLAQTGRVDAALTITTDDPSRPDVHYLFSGEQFYRYSGNDFDAVDEGYPKRIQTALRAEPPFASLDAPAERGIDGVWADRGSVFVFLADRIYASSPVQVRRLQSLGIDAPRAVDIDDGHLSICSAKG